MIHYLLVEEFWDEDFGQSFDRWIKHKNDCPTEIIDIGPEGQKWEEFTCDVGYWESYYGLEDLADDPRYNTSGKYKIDFYSYWSGSSFDDSEAYLFYVDEA